MATKGQPSSPGVRYRLGSVTMTPLPSARLFAARWARGEGVTVTNRTEPSISPGSVRAHFDDGDLTSVVAFHRTHHRAERLVMEHVRDLLSGPAT